MVKKVVSVSDNTKTYACKIMRVPDEELYMLSLKEFTILDKLSAHENIIRVEDIFYNAERQTTKLVMEYFPNSKNMSKLVKMTRRDQMS